MKKIIVTTLILLGGIWLFYATIVPSVMRNRALSDAMQLEANLKGWASGKVAEGKLTESDVREIFPGSYSLRFGGENPSRNFREMVERNAQSSAPPIWPGVVIVSVAVITAFRLPSPTQAKQEAKQNVDPNV